VGGIGFGWGWLGLFLGSGEFCFGSVNC